jgi:hypothetical protein
MTDGSAGGEIWFLNRGLVILRPKQPFVDWVREVDPGTPTEEDEVRESAEAFLIPQFDMTPDSHVWIRENFEMMFEIQLDSWYTDPEMWPSQRDWDTFTRWFEIELIEVAWDLVDAPLSSDAPPVGED